MEEIADLMHEVLLSQDESALTNVLDRWRIKSGLSSFAISVDACHARDLVTNAALSHRPAPYSAYLDNGLYTVDPVANHPFKQSHVLSWQVENWKEINPEYYEYLSQETGIKSGVSIPLRKLGDRTSAATFFSHNRSGVDQRTIAEARILSAGVVARLTAFGSVSSQDDVIQRIRSLSRVQLLVLELAATGKTNAEIAAILDIKRRTVEYHMAEILKKLRVSTRVQASVMFASL